MKREGNNKQFNNGFSLVELIVVIAIMAVLATGIIVAFTNSSSQKSKSAVTLLSQYLENTFNYSVSKDKSYLTIRYDANKERYYVNDSQGHEEQLISGIDITYDITDGSSDNLITEEQPLMVSFSRTNGAFTPIITGFNEDGSFIYMSNMGDTGEASYQYLSKLKIVSGDTERDITLYPKTGKHVVENAKSVE